MLKEFKEFILKGNMLDLAVGVIIGGAFGTVVKEFTGVILGLIAWFTPGKAEVKGLYISGTKVNLDGFLNSIISLIILGFALFLIVKAYNVAKARFEKPATAPEPTAQEKLLAEIRDLLKQKS